MASPLKNLIINNDRYVKAFNHIMERSTVHQSMHDFMDNLLPDILSSTLNGKSHVNVIGVGSASGELDLKMFSVIHQKYPRVTVVNEVVEPDSQQLCVYRDLVSRTPDLDYIQFNWNEMTVQEIEEHWNEKKMTKKADIIHMFQVLYYVKDRGATIRFFQSLLNKNGKLLITLVSGESGSAKLRQTFAKELCDTGINVTMADIKQYLDSEGVSYQSYMLPCRMDITECFTEGDENGELLIDFLTHVQYFGATASPELKAGVMAFLRHPDYSEESNGKVLWNVSNELIVIDQLT